MDTTLAAFRAGAAAARVVPGGVADWVAELGGSLAVKLRPGAAAVVARHQARVQGPLDDRRARRAVRAVFRSYARYWSTALRLPSMTVGAIAAGHEVVGYHHVVAARQRGRGVILALPHLGGWEWSGFWLTRVQQVPVTVVVEPLDPPELFEWFAEFRRNLGMRVVALGPDAGREVLAALARNEVVCLLADRDLTGGGVEVEFFGERTTLPAGPAVMALRAEVDILPTAVYFRRRGVVGVVRPPLDVARHGRLRDDVARVTQAMAHELEALIRAAPEQWHLLQPNWPSDPGSERSAGTASPAEAGAGADGDERSTA